VTKNNKDRIQAHQSMKRNSSFSGVLSLSKRRQKGGNWTMEPKGTGTCAKDRVNA
jgi:hypothetical protein